jgi:hypothetical protein
LFNKHLIYFSKKKQYPGNFSRDCNLSHTLLNNACSSLCSFRNSRQNPYTSWSAKFNAKEAVALYLSVTDFSCAIEPVIKSSNVNHAEVSTLSICGVITRTSLSFKKVITFSAWHCSSLP